MIASLFKKSTPLNYMLVALAAVLCFFIWQIGRIPGTDSLFQHLLRLADLCVMLGSLFITNFIVKKNNMSRDSSYTILFYFLFLLFFPSLLSHSRLIFANFFILLALRRLISLHSTKATKEKIFDASLWVFAATMFNFWCIIFILLVFISILFHGARDYRKWFLPLLAFGATVTVFLMAALIFDHSWIRHLISNAHYDLSIRYFTNELQNISLSAYATVAIFFIVSLLLTLPKRPLILHSSFKKILWGFFIGAGVYVLSPSKSNDLLIFTFAPLAIMVTAFVEFTQVKWHRDVIVATLICGSLFLFLVQL